MKGKNFKTYLFIGALILCFMSSFSPVQAKPINVNPTNNPLFDEPKQNNSMELSLEFEKT